MSTKKFLDAEGAAAMVEQIKVNAGFQMTSYAELKSLVANSALVPGRKYRFRYKCIVDELNARPDIRSNGADFDLIVTAQTANKLKSEARAAKPFIEALNPGNPKGLSYFENSDLTKWRIWYDINNDETKYDWATPNGYGVIYRMIDEFGNDVPYDFKNIMFFRSSMPDVVQGDIIGCVQVNQSHGGGGVPIGNSTGGTVVVFTDVTAGQVFKNTLTAPQYWGTQIPMPVMDYCGIYSYTQEQWLMPDWDSSNVDVDYVFTFDRRVDDLGNVSSHQLITAEQISNTVPVWSSYGRYTNAETNHPSSTGPILGSGTGENAAFASYTGVLDASTYQTSLQMHDASLNDYEGLVKQSVKYVSAITVFDCYNLGKVSNNVIKPAYADNLWADQSTLYPILTNGEWLSDWYDVPDGSSFATSWTQAQIDAYIARVQSMIKNHTQILNNIVCYSWEVDNSSLSNVQVSFPMNSNENLWTVSYGNTFLDNCANVTVMPCCYGNTFAGNACRPAIWGWCTVAMQEIAGSEIARGRMITHSDLNNTKSDLQVQITTVSNSINNCVSTEDAVPMDTIAGWFGEEYVEPTDGGGGATVIDIPESPGTHPVLPGGKK